MPTITISSVDTDLDKFTSSQSHNLTTGDAIKMVADSPPGGTVNGTLYYARVISTTEFAIHTTSANAKSNTSTIDLTSAGSSVTFQTRDPQVNTDEFSLSVEPSTALEVIDSEFVDYSRELVFVEEVVGTGFEVILHGYEPIQVFMQGLTTSPTYIYTDGSPKAAPGPAVVSEVWYLS
jgi:hypothetical protein